LTKKELLDDKYRPEGPIRSKGTGPKAVTFKRDRPERPIRSKATGPKGQYVQKRSARRAIRLRKSYWMINLIASPKDQYVQKGITKPIKNRFISFGFHYKGHQVKK
jgi:hypothetical protein